MTDKEKLEGIKKGWFRLSNNEIDWLIEQAEKVEQLEHDLKAVKGVHLFELLKTLDSYQQALKDVVDNYGKISSLELLEIVQKALKG